MHTETHTEKHGRESSLVTEIFMEIILSSKEVMTIVVVHKAYVGRQAADKFETRKVFTL